MTVISSATGSAATAERPASSSFVEWGAIIAGAVLAASISLVLITFGTALGLSMTSAWPDSGASSKWTLSLAAFWVLAQQIGAFLAGGYVAGRMRQRPELRSNETEFRDGIHGGLVWAVGVAIGAMLAASAASTVARVGAEAGRAAVSTASQNAGQMAYFADMMLRPNTATPQQGQPNQPAGAQPPPAQAQPIPQETRAEIGRVLTRAAVNRELSQNDRNYLASLVAQRTGLSQDEAQRRVTDTFNEMERTVRDAADKARHAAALGGFITAASIVIGFAAAWWGAIRGGHHRDNNFAHTGLYLRSRRVQEFEQ